MIALLRHRVLAAFDSGSVEEFTTALGMIHQIPYTPTEKPGSAAFQGEPGLRTNEKSDSTHNTKGAYTRNALRAHTDGRFSVPIDGHWIRRIPTLTQDDYLALLYPDRERLVLYEFKTRRSVTAG